MAKFVVTAIPQGVFFTIVDADDVDAARKYAEEHYGELEWASDEDLGPGEIDEVTPDEDGSVTAAFEAAESDDDDEGEDDD